MKVIGLGVGRTGTYSLKKALERLGLGPCHHMEVVLQHMAEQVPLWTAAANGRPDWDAIYRAMRVRSTGQLPASPGSSRPHTHRPSSSSPCGARRAGRRATRRPLARSWP